jgi:hypothetical protein
MQCLSRALGRATTALHRRSIPGNGALPMVRPYVLVVAEARPNGAVSW